MQNLQSALVQDILYKNEDIKTENTQTTKDPRRETVQCGTESTEARSTLQTVGNSVECVVDGNECFVDAVECVSEMVEEHSYCSTRREQISEFTAEECTVECIENTNTRGDLHKDNEELVTVCSAEEEAFEDTSCMMVTVSCTEEVERDHDVCMVECAEIEAALEFEVVSMEDCEDTRSTGSGDHVRTEEIVLMHAEETIVEQVPQSPHEKALLKRR